ncbi:glycine betaine ABC transporter substrate-binding protein [Geoalkalibacter halelectricus]|uniref:Glycine betaine ABC transporter substrate-binding protein n=1 Tax=Geoalkalibacter halelectricus TaxID=2847045 RepID=A0ABY5ZPN7_9BACT|nr:glycine betaine ABC transporter substrate-binding protein [Geoalkalibacter halelectricus]MDO3378233.1 glycine betaine ABC transporter substrate-binding protein [Geoalkalibacter halelectricus]UWZ79176.1 glycine betaine ABC transporter substrate-binding protein [Geoalkalibacter halelectricus]
MKGSLKTCAVALLVMFALLVVGCQRQEEAQAPQRVDLIYVEWSSEVASTNVVAAVLQEELGYEVRLTPVSAAAMWQGIAGGDADAMVAAWLPTTHGHYLERLREQVVDLGPNLDGTRIGLVVPTYVEISSIDELNENAERFDGRIIGIDPGAGLMSKTEEVMEAYGLDNLRLMEGSGATMTAALADAINREQWVVVTGWTPHWKFAQWDLKYLEDPQNVYGGDEQIHTIVRQGLEQDMPEVFRFLQNFSWTTDDMQQVMVWNREEGATPYETAKRWVAENPARVQAWLR